MQNSTYGRQVYKLRNLLDLITTRQIVSPLLFTACICVIETHTLKALHCFNAIRVQAKGNKFSSRPQ